ncbi:M20 family metallopeptidase [Sphingoaurantiacus capsulatus]|uniref:M20 family metallopeptidase n=1 Tax=Sphingoaurantiacus capsulatus TaxID=1771310 RepID=A0ABV7XGT7_9SPHN
MDISARIDRARLSRTLLELIAIPSVNPFGRDGDVGPEFGEVRAAGYVADRLAKLGWATEVDEFVPGRANALCRRAADRGANIDGRPAIVFAGHLDTVEVDGYDAPFASREEGGRIYGRGACDMKAAIACYIEVAEILAAEGIELNGELIVAGVADEEYRQEGAKAAKPHLPPTQLVVIGEPTEMKVCVAAKGLAAYTLSVEGQATHGSVPNAGRNAILRAAELLPAFGRHAHHLTCRAHPLLGPGVLNVGVIRGGLKPNIVPSSCEAEISRRLLPDETPASARDLVLGELEAVGGDRDWQLSDAWWAVDPYENGDGNIVAAFQQAAAAAGVADVTATGFPASSDAAYFGAPVVIFGPGSLDQAHSLDEWVEVDEMVSATAAYLRFVLDRLA